MSEPSFRGPHDTALLILGGATVALVAALLSVGPGTAATHPAVVWALLLLPALVFAATARLLNPSLVLALSILALGVLELTRPVSPEMRWWMGGALSTLMAAGAALAFRRRMERRASRPAAAERPAGPDVPEGDPAAGDGSATGERIVGRSIVDLFLRRQLAAAGRGEKLSVVLVNLDRFDEFRDVHGQGAAEQLLSRVERSLRATIRDSDVVGRYGEHQFLTLLLGEDQRGAYIYADRVQRKISRLAVESADGSFIDSGVTVSAGIASFHESLSTPSELVEAAQRTLDAAVEQGGDRILVARSPASE